MFVYFFCILIFLFIIRLFMTLCYLFKHLLLQILLVLLKN